MGYRRSGNRRAGCGLLVEFDGQAVPGRFGGEGAETARGGPRQPIPPGCAWDTAEESCCVGWSPRAGFDRPSAPAGTGIQPFAGGAPRPAHLAIEISCLGFGPTGPSEFLQSPACSTLPWTATHRRFEKPIPTLAHLPVHRPTPLVPRSAGCGFPKPNVHESIVMACSMAF